ncbi:MAG TPA: hypothetical protein VD995_29300 [Azospirillum sp.]|nr:hypothetical protein [Azospirillum sp.]
MPMLRAFDSDVSKDASSAHVLRRLEETPVDANPFPHCVVPGILPEELYARALAHWPVTEELRLLQPGDLPLRYQAVIDDKWLDAQPAESAAVWREVRDALFNPGVIELMAERFPQIREKLKWTGRPPMLVARIIEDHAGHAMLPHTDMEATMFSMLVYMPEDDRTPHLGTAIYRPRDPDFRGRGFDRYPRGDFELVGHAPYRPNHLLTYAPSDRSFHGVEPVEAPCVRRLLIFFAIVDSRVRRR